MIIIDFLDLNLSKFWLWFNNTEIAHYDMLEAMVAGFSFAFWIMMYRTMDQLTFFYSYRFHKELKPLPLFRKNAPNAWIPLILYFIIIRIYHNIYPKPIHGNEIPTLFRIIFELIEGIIYYDFIFFWIHYFMHKNNNLSWFFQHYVHHNQKLLCANEVQHHSLVDGSLQVIVNIIVQNISLYGWLFNNLNIKKHFLSRLCHNIIITYMLTESHAGYNGFWCLHNVFPYFIGGAARHEIHHNIGNKYYQPFFMYLDDTLEYFGLN